MTRSRIALVSWTPLIAWCCLIYYLSSIPGDELTLPSFSGSDKLLHACAYGMIGWLFSLAWNHSFVRVKAYMLKGFYSAVLFTALFGLSDEWHQLYVSGRTCSVWDLAADLVGGAAGAFLFLLWRKRSQHD